VDTFAGSSAARPDEPPLEELFESPGFAVVPGVPGKLRGSADTPPLVELPPPDAEDPLLSANAIAPILSKLTAPNAMKIPTLLPEFEPPCDPWCGVNGTIIGAPPVAGPWPGAA
jgi:hypothetical protein